MSMQHLVSKARSVFDSTRFEIAIAGLIVLNAVTIGLETVPSVMERAGPLLMRLDRAILFVFAVEIALKLLVYRLGFFRDPWKLFDFAIVTIALLPASGALSVLRSLRILRALRLVSMVPSLKRVVGGLIAALPGMGSIMALLALVFYVFAVIATKLYGESFPQWFGSVPASAYSLFQIMTLESWSMGIVRPVMEVHPMAWLFFVPFIVCTTFTVLNLFIGIIVSAMQAEHEAEVAAEQSRQQADHEQVLAEVRKLQAQVAELAARGK